MAQEQPLKRLKKLIDDDDVREPLQAKDFLDVEAEEEGNSNPSSEDEGEEEEEDDGFICDSPVSQGQPPPRAPSPEPILPRSPRTPQPNQEADETLNMPEPVPQIQPAPEPVVHREYIQLNVPAPDDDDCLPDQSNYLAQMPNPNPSIFDDGFNEMDTTHLWNANAGSSDAIGLESFSYNMETNGYVRPYAIQHMHQHLYKLGHYEIQIRNANASKEHYWRDAVEALQALLNPKNDTDERFHKYIPSGQENLGTGITDFSLEGRIRLETTMMSLLNCFCALVNTAKSNNNILWKYRTNKFVRSNGEVVCEYGFQQISTGTFKERLSMVVPSYSREDFWKWSTARPPAQLDNFLGAKGARVMKTKKRKNEETGETELEVEVTLFGKAQISLDVKLTAADIWLGHSGKNNFAKVVFNPRPPYSKENPDGYKPEEEFNTWCGLSIEPHHVKNITAHWRNIQPLLCHIRYTWCSNDDEFKYVIQYMASIIQRPWQKLNVMLIIWGREGTGKTGVFDLIGRIIGNRHYVNIQNMEDVVGEFNSVLKDKILVNIDEFNVDGTREESLLKNLLTNNMRRFRDMYNDPWMGENLANFTSSTNTPQKMMPVGENARRYAFLYSDVETYLGLDFNKKVYGEGPEAKSLYFQKLFQPFDPEEDGSHSTALLNLAKFLYRVDLSDFEPGIIPINEHLVERKKQSFGLVLRWWHLCLKQGYLEDFLDPRTGKKKRRRFVAKMELDVVHHAFLATDYSHEKSAPKSVAEFRELLEPYFPDGTVVKDVVLSANGVDEEMVMIQFSNDMGVDVLKMLRNKLDAKVPGIRITWDPDSLVTRTKLFAHPDFPKKHALNIPVGIQGYHPDFPIRMYTSRNPYRPTTKKKKLSAEKLREMNRQLFDVHLVAMRNQAQGVQVRREPTGHNPDKEARQ